MYGGQRRASPIFSARDTIARAVPTRARSSALTRVGEPIPGSTRDRVEGCACGNVRGAICPLPVCLQWNTQSQTRSIYSCVERREDWVTAMPSSYDFVSARAMHVPAEKEARWQQAPTPLIGFLCFSPRQI